MVFSLNKSDAHKIQDIKGNYLRLMQQFTVWEKKYATSQANEHCFKTLEVELDTIKAFYNDFMNSVVLPTEQNVSAQLPEFITQEDIFRLLSYKVFMPMAQIFAEREPWMQRIAGTNRKNAQTSSGYCTFKNLVANYPNKFAIEQSIHHFEQGTLKYHHDWEAAKRQINKDLKSLSALCTSWKESKNSFYTKKASILADFISSFEKIPLQLSAKEEQRFKQTERYKTTLATDKFKAAHMLNEHLSNYPNPQEELAEKIKLMQPLIQNKMLFAHRPNAIGWLQTQLHVTPEVLKKLDSLEESLKKGEKTLAAYLKHTAPPPQKAPQSKCPSRMKEPKNLGHQTEITKTAPVTRQITLPIASLPKQKSLGKVYLRVQEYEEALHRFSLFTHQKPSSDVPLKCTYSLNRYMLMS